MTTRGFDRLERSMLNADLLGALEDVAVEEADRYLELLEEEAPEDQGELKDSFDAEISRENESLVIDVESSAEHYEYVVRGTRNTPANNFPDRAYQRWIDEAEERIKDEMTEYLDEQVFER